MIFTEFEYYLDSNLSLFERIKANKEIQKKFGMDSIGLPSVQVVVTPNHPFWVEGKGWVAANQITIEDIVVDKKEK